MVRIAGVVWESMVAHARAAYPEECCGALLGSVDGGDRQIEAALALENVRGGERRTGYELRAGDLVCAEEQARRLGLRLAGIYHSHPDTDACFSRADSASACPWLCYLVLSVRGGELAEASAWLPASDGAPAEEEIVIGPLSAR